MRNFSLNHQHSMKGALATFFALCALASVAMLATPASAQNGASQTSMAAESAYFTDQGYAEFISSAPWLEFKGVSSSLTGLIDLDKNILDFYIDLTTLDTGIRLRNKNMRDSYLETDLYPFAEFQGELVEVPRFESGDSARVTATGTFTIHGVSKDLEVSGVLVRENGALGLAAAWEVALSDFNIQRPAIVSYQLNEIIRIRIEGRLTPYVPDADAADSK